MSINAEYLKLQGYRCEYQPEEASSGRVESWQILATDNHPIITSFLSESHAWQLTLAARKCSNCGYIWYDTETIIGWLGDEETGEAAYECPNCKTMIGDSRWLRVFPS